MSQEFEQRTLNFSMEVVSLCRAQKASSTERPILSQLMRSATSIGANYREANSAASEKDFKNKIHICKKEAEETKYWLDILRACDVCNQQQLAKVTSENQQFILIFGKIISTINSKIENSKSKIK